MPRKGYRPERSGRVRRNPAASSGWTLACQSIASPRDSGAPDGRRRRQCPEPPRDDTAPLRSRRDRCPDRNRRSPDRGWGGHPCCGRRRRHSPSCCCGVGRTPYISWLVDNGADLAARDARGRTPSTRPPRPTIPARPTHCWPGERIPAHSTLRGRPQIRRHASTGTPRRSPWRPMRMWSRRASTWEPT